MDTETDQIILEESGTTFQLKKSLTPIDEYAAREGVSRSVIEECAKLGIVHIRKFKGKSFVVDVPLSPYACSSQTIDGSNQPIDKTAYAGKITELARRVIPESERACDKPSGPDNQNIEPGKISELIKRMLARASQITGRPVEEIYNEISQTKPASEPVPAPLPAAAPLEAIDEPIIQNENITPTPEPLEVIDEPTMQDEEITPAETMPEPPLPSQPQAFGSVEDLFRRPSDETAEQEESPAPITVPRRNDELQFYMPTAQSWSKSTWRTVAICSIGFFAVALLINFWLYADRRGQLDKLDKVYASIQSVYDASAQTARQIETLRNDLSSSAAESERLRTELAKAKVENETIRAGQDKAEKTQKELDGTKAELKAVRDELAAAKQNLETIQKSNTEAVGRLNKQIQKLTIQLSELSRPSSSSPGTGN